MKKHEKTESELLEQCAARFESKSMRIMTVKEYELEFDTTFPKPNPNRKTKPGIVDPMVKSEKRSLRDGHCGI